MVKTDYIVFNKLNDKYLFYNIIIFDPVTGDILFDNNSKYLFSIIQDVYIKDYHFGCDIKYYKKRIPLTFLKKHQLPICSIKFFI